MPRRKVFDKKNATTFALVHRAQNDPLIHDADAAPMVFAEIQGPSTQPPQAAKKQRKIKQRGDLEDEFGMNFKANEGQAAEHGVYYDDTEYDYMQHMRDLGSGGGAVTWLDAPADKTKKAKGKMKLEDALRDMDIQSEGGVSTASTASLLPEDAMGSEFVRKTTYQDMQNVPDAIAGFQPDMDPRLREVLEALEDEAYVDDEDDIFAELAADGEEVDQNEWQDSDDWYDDEGDGAPYDHEDGGWESDDTIKADDMNKVNSPRALSPSSAALAAADSAASLPPLNDTTAPPPSDPADGAWLEEFTKFKRDVKAAKGLPPKPAGAAPSESINTGLSSLASGRRKKRKGAKTSTSNYSMTSSALARTDAQTLLDARFDKIEEDYAEDGYPDDDDDYGSQFDDSASAVSGVSRASAISRMSAASGMSRASGISSYSRASDAEAPELVRSDFDSIMDGFLAGHSRTGGRGRFIKKSGYQTGLEQLDEIRGGLGPARKSKRLEARNAPAAPSAAASAFGAFAK
ncbi:hypothetical protein MBLNU459_g5344t1 [Dothideomycetes sp. NU459]